jgi:hypothetical protein
MLFFLSFCFRPWRSPTNLLEARFNEGIRIDIFAVGTDVIKETAFDRARVIRFEECRMDANFDIPRALWNPLDICLWFLSFFVENCSDFGDFAVRIFGKAGCRDGIWHVEKAYCLTRRQAEIVLAIHLTEIGMINVNSFSDGNFMRTKFGTLRRERNIGLTFTLFKRVCIFKYNLERVKHEHEARDSHFQVSANTLFESGQSDKRIRRGYAQVVDERENSARGYASPS